MSKVTTHSFLTGDSFLKSHKTALANFYSSPGLTWTTALKMNKVQLGLLIS